MVVRIGVQIKLLHTGTRTSMGERVADTPRRGTWRMSIVNRELPDGKDVSARASKVLARWIGNPMVTRALGRKGLLEVTGRCEVELCRDQAGDPQEGIGVREKEGRDRGLG